MLDKSPERLPLIDVFHSFHVCLYMHCKPITLLTKIFSAPQRDIKMSLRRDSNLGELDFQDVQDEIAQKKSKTKTSYQKHSAEGRFKIGKYASENGAIAAVRKFKNSYPDVKESIVREFKSNYEEELKKAKRQSRTMAKAFPEKKRGRPVILGATDLMVQEYLKV